MMQVFIENRQIDLMANEDLLITREIADIREPEKRSSDWSKTFRIPGTSNNNKIFGHIFDINQEQLNSGSQFAPDFNPNKKAGARITVDEVEQIRGFVRLLNIAIVRKGEIEYEVSVHGVAADFFAKIRNKRMSEIDLSDLNHIPSKTIVKNSWNNTWQDGYVYGMADRGREDKPLNIWGVGDLTPCVFAKTIVDRIFTDAGYTYTSDSFFNTDEFKSRIIPFSKYPELSQSFLDDLNIKARRSSITALSVGSTIVWNDDSSSGFYDNGGNYSTANGEYTLPYSGIAYSAELKLHFEVTGLSSVTYPELLVSFEVKIGGKRRGKINAILTNQPSLGGAIDFTSYIMVGSGGAGEKITVELEGVYHNEYTAFGMRLTRLTTGWTVSLQTGSYLRLDALQMGFGPGYTLDFNSLYGSSEQKQDAFIADLIKLDNLYLETTDKANELFIQPREQFYRDSVVHDITSIIDRSQPMDILPMGELEGNPYVFTYKAGKDIDSEDYSKATGKVYGEARIIVDNEFLSNERKIETGFASTPYIHAGGQVAIASMEAYDKANGEPRILYWSGKITSFKWILADWVDTTGAAINPELIENGYPHIGHLDNPFAPTKDLCYGMPQYINLPGGITYTNNNLYNRNWRKYVNEITDRNSKIVKVKAYVNPANWAKWSFRDLYFFDGQYFRLNKITDYPVGGAEVVECEFLKLKTGNQFTPQTGRTGSGYDVKDEFNNRWPDLRNGFDKPARNFSYFDIGGGNSGNYKPIFDVVQGLDDIYKNQFDPPSTGDKYRPTIEWSGTNWDIVLIEEI